MRSTLLLLLPLAALASARKCSNATVPVTIAARTGLFGGIDLPTTNLDAMTFIQNLTQQGRNFTETALTGYRTQGGTYHIHTTFCQPDGQPAAHPVVQVLTHGVGFDASYWDLPFNGYNYSYVNAALAAGFCTLTYDRLGIGQSTHGDPLNEIQSFLEIAALHALITQLSTGEFPLIQHAFGKDIVAVGHSFGSAQTASLVDAYPDSVRAAIFTGFSLNSTFVPTFAAGGNFQQANLNAPLRFGNVSGAEAMSLLAASPLANYMAGVDLAEVPDGQDLPAGYLVANNAPANQLLFFHPGGFDPAILSVVEATKQPATVGELLTLGAVPTKNRFAGPVMVLDGDADVPYCGGNCTATGRPDVASLAAAVKAGFPMVDKRNFSSYIQPRTGHGTNLHYAAKDGYREIMGFLKSKGIVSK